jgi:hypothetical protein
MSTTGDTTLTAAQQRFLAILDLWVLEHGDAQVPQHAVVPGLDGEDYRLGLRVKDARRAHGGGRLPPAMVRELERRSGWSWTTRDDRQRTAWRHRLEELQRHVAATDGQLRELPTPLRRWLVAQRAQLAAGTLPPERLAQLERVPGALERRDTRVAAFVAAARAWLDAIEGRSMTQLKYTDTITIDGQTVPLGRQATYYRRRYHSLAGTHPLPEHEVELIATLPGWRWELDERGRNRRRSTAQPDATATGQPHAPGSERGYDSADRGSLLGRPVNPEA